ncbi:MULTISPECIES: SDR family oxidoreductase [unclassified Brenneria]|uniref:SDR family oxidoreductase n=1 Tax=unclassified Brenneria TaxID=2634434 RepID=UPI0015522ED6|nr:MULTISPECIES: SDR family NAD(P)-dependent oxidoreductase [unclassified Brenneria]MBJ7222054.1 SDR family oxidoreductase [Brenneria sp. L3-3C-1]MEE3643297.1 SDR family NAD(P)-dependent oxidoreductase [Brenneria sp. L3_3C_1]MEE3650514.1 SDR family NAD(P)-dependent oxidoreductase [Brenneria sp. HEZEL_4_2_4]NPD00469.1 SDR family oxidoreductase [Brenneria sp. hezel4-2-4]
MSKSVVITGAARGIGKAVTEYFIQQGEYDVIAIIRRHDRIEQLMTEWQNINPSCRIDIKAADFSDRHAVEKVCRALSQKKNIAVLINNAGIFYSGTVDIDYQRLLDLTTVNFLSPFLITHTVVNLMRENKQGYIFNIASNSARRPIPGIGAYSASKHALLGFSESLMLDLLPYNIKVSNINPAFVDTDMTRGFPGVTANDKIQTDDIVRCISFLLSLSAGAIVPNIDVECVKFL